MRQGKAFHHDNASRCQYISYHYVKCLWKDWNIYPWEPVLSMIIIPSFVTDHLRKYNDTLPNLESEATTWWLWIIGGTQNKLIVTQLWRAAISLSVHIGKANQSGTVTDNQWIRWGLNSVTEYPARFIRDSMRTVKPFASSESLDIETVKGTSVLFIYLSALFFQ